ncbi:unnamed protein product [Gordionus sp. m RMFG-2023]
MILLKYLSPRNLREKFSDLIEGLIDSLRSTNTTSNIAECGKNVYFQRQQQNLSDYIVSSPWPDIDLPHPSTKISDFMFQAFEKYGDRKALVDSLTHKSLSFKDLLEKSKRIAGSLSLRNISLGHRAAIIAQNTPDFLPVFLALNKLGVTIALISPLSTKDEIDLLHTVRDALNQVPSFKQNHLFCMEPLTQSFKTLLDPIKITKSYPVKNETVFDILPKIFTVSDLCRENLSTFKTNIPTQKVAVIPFSSGTTGKPKGVMLTNSNVVANILQSQCVIDQTIYRVVSGLLPFFHIYGFTVNLLNTLSMGNTVVTFSTLEPSVYLNGLEKYKVSFLFIVPTVAQFLINYRYLNKFDLSNVIHIFNGASRLPLSQAKNLKKVFKQNVHISQGYGMTEMSPVSHCMPIDSDYTESIGLTIPNTLCKIVDIDTKETLSPNNKGELCIKGPQVMLGYLNNPEATKEMIVDGWLHTGDVAYYNNDGYFFLTDRMKELIKYKGFQVAPAEIESILIAHPDIIDAAVIGMPDENVGELPTAFIVAKKVVTAKMINELINGKLSAHKWLRGGIHFIDQIPKSASGKVLRRELKAIAQNTTTNTKYHKFNEK